MLNLKSAVQRRRHLAEARGVRVVVTAFSRLKQFIEAAMKYIDFTMEQAGGREFHRRPWEHPYWSTVDIHRQQYWQVFLANRTDDWQLFWTKGRHLTWVHPLLSISATSSKTWALGSF